MFFVPGLDPVLPLLLGQLVLLQDSVCTNTMTSPAAVASSRGNHREFQRGTKQHSRFQQQCVRRRATPAPSGARRAVALVVAFDERVPLRQQPVVGEVPGLVGIFVVVAILGLDRVRRQQHRRLRGTVVLIVQDGLLHLVRREGTSRHMGLIQCIYRPPPPPQIPISNHLNYTWMEARYLQEEESLGDLLNEFLRDILREELGPELELQRVLLLHILLSHLEDVVPSAGHKLCHTTYIPQPGV